MPPTKVVQPHREPTPAPVENRNVVCAGIATPLAFQAARRDLRRRIRELPYRDDGVAAGDTSHPGALVPSSSASGARGPRSPSGKLGRSGGGAGGKRGFGTPICRNQRTVLCAYCARLTTYGAHA